MRRVSAKARRSLALGVSDGGMSPVWVEGVRLASCQTWASRLPLLKLRFELLRLMEWLG